ncbi:MAG: hypothetical protein V3W20_13535 [Candidatus Neomarinimicrobiota bacterium]
MIDLQKETYWWISKKGNQFTIDSATEYYAKKRVLLCIEKYIDTHEKMEIIIPLLGRKIKISRDAIKKSIAFSDLIENANHKENVQFIWDLYIK